MPKKKPTRKKTICVRVDHIEAIERAAARRKMSVSEFTRFALYSAVPSLKGEAKDA
jgi:uncharacterized protein (DUF1778 family)